MFRNSLFLKIVIIFTIPVMGILLFSSFMVYEKINIIEDLKHNELRLDYIKNSEKLIISLKQEKMISLEQLSNNITPLTNNLKSQLAYCTFGCLKKLATF